MNLTMGLEGFVTSILVHGIIRCLKAKKCQLLDQTYRMYEIKTTKMSIIGQKITGILYFN